MSSSSGGKDARTSTFSASRSKTGVAATMATARCRAPRSAPSPQSVRDAEQPKYRRSPVATTNRVAAASRTSRARLDDASPRQANGSSASKTARRVALASSSG